MFVCFVYITPYLQFSEKRCNYLKLIRNPNQIEPHKDITHLFPCATDTRVLKHNIYSLSRARSCREHCATGTGTQLGPRPLGPAASFRKALRVQMSPTIAHAHFISFFKFLYAYTFNLILWTYTHTKKNHMHDVNISHIWSYFLMCWYHVQAYILWTLKWLLLYSFLKVWLIQSSVNSYSLKTVITRRLEIKLSLDAS